MPSLILDNYDTLTNLGLKVIPLRPNSKIPLCRRWTQEWDPKTSRVKLQQFPDCNIGLLLGTVIDVEGDSEWANQTLTALIGDYPHPAYTSTRSTHHLFSNPNDLKLLKFKDIEFRGFGHQSVLPPSQHQGVEYRWIQEINGNIPPMPTPLLEFYSKIQKRNGPKLKPRHVAITCSRCGEKCYLHQKRLYLEIEVFRELGRSWECHSCRTVDLRPLCRKFRKDLYRNHQDIPRSFR